MLSCISELISREVQDPIDHRTKWRSCSPQTPVILSIFKRHNTLHRRRSLLCWRFCDLTRITIIVQKNDKLIDIGNQNNILDISSGFLHLAGNSLIPETIGKKCLEDAKVLHQVDKKFIPITAGRTLAVIDQVCR